MLHAPELSFVASTRAPGAPSSWARSCAVLLRPVSRLVIAIVCSGRRPALAAGDGGGGDLHPAQLGAACVAVRAVRCRALRWIGCIVGGGGSNCVCASDGRGVRVRVSLVLTERASERLCCTAHVQWVNGWVRIPLFGFGAIRAQSSVDSIRNRFRNKYFPARACSLCRRRVARDSTLRQRHQHSEPEARSDRPTAPHP